MKIGKSLIVYSMLTVLCGIISFIVSVTLWYLISGVNNLTLPMAALPFVVCWCIAGIIAWGIKKSLSRLAFTTYIFATILFDLICFAFTYTVDSSVKAWLVAAAIGFFICSFPSFLILKFIGIPKMINSFKQNEHSQ